MNAKEMSAELARLNALTQSLNNQVLSLLDRVTKLETGKPTPVARVAKPTFETTATYKWTAAPVGTKQAMKLYEAQKDSVGFTLKDATKVVEKLVKTGVLTTKNPGSVAESNLRWAFNKGMLAIVKPVAPAAEVLVLDNGVKEVKIGEDGKAVVEDQPAE